MKAPYSILLGLLATSALHAATTYTDSTLDIDPTIATGGGTLDIVSMEVANTATDINFKLTVNGNVGATDWGKFMIGISNPAASNGDLSTNGWGRPIQMLVTPSVGMTHWIGSWVDGGGGSQLWTYNSSGNQWSGPASLSGYSFSSNGSTSTMDYTVSLSALGLAMGDSIMFDAYSSGGGGGDTAIDALANPNVSVTSWGQTYVSLVSSNGFNVYGLNSYTVVPEPTSWAFLTAGALAALGMRRRR